jgi:membrane protein implicated in regulation of membrane protease activity
MPIEFWFWVWLLLAALLFVGEMLTTTLFLLPFAIGASAALAAQVLGGALWLQWLLFVVVAVGALFALRPLARKLTAHSKKQVSGVDRLIGKTGEIIEGNAPSGESRARVEREIWNVNILNGPKPAVGTTVKVLAVNGTHLIVEEVTK